MEIRVLGAVQAWRDEHRFDLGPRKQRLALAILALNVNKLVTVSRLVDLTWPEAPPPTAQHAIHVRVSALRGILSAPGCRPGPEIITHGSAYMLQVDPMRIDLHRFRAIVARAGQDLPDARRVELLRSALDLWHGPPLADVATPDVADRLCRGLEEARLAAAEDCYDAELRLGRHAALLPELAELAPNHPYRHRLQGQLMLALHRCGRGPEALQWFQKLRTRLADELGLEPDRALQRLQRAILRADAEADPPSRPLLRNGTTLPRGAGPDTVRLALLAATTPGRHRTTDHRPASLNGAVPATLRPASGTNAGEDPSGLAVEVRELCRHDGKYAGLCGLSFTAQAGEVVALIGPSGSGKTTAVRLLATFLAPSSGDFVVAGVPNSRPDEVRQRIGFVPRGVRYGEHLTGWELLTYYARLAGQSRREAADTAGRLLAEVGLACAAGQRINGYPRASVQRLAIACALLNNPLVLLLDEPTVGLGRVDQRQLLALLQAVARRRTVTVVFTTHRLADVDGFCSVVVNLDAAGAEPPARDPVGLDGTSV